MLTKGLVHLESYNINRIDAVPVIFKTRRSCPLSLSVAYLNAWQEVKDQGPKTLRGEMKFPRPSVPGCAHLFAGDGTRRNPDAIFVFLLPDLPWHRRGDVRTLSPRAVPQGNPPGRSVSRLKRSVEQLSRPPISLDSWRIPSPRDLARERRCKGKYLKRERERERAKMVRRYRLKRGGEHSRRWTVCVTSLDLSWDRLPRTESFSDTLLIVSVVVKVKDLTTSRRGGMSALRGRSTHFGAVP